MEWWQIIILLAACIIIYNFVVKIIKSRISLYEILFSVLKIAFVILLLPISIIISVVSFIFFGNEHKCKISIINEYEKLFNTTSKKDIKSTYVKIEYLTKKLRNINEKEQEKIVKELLNKCKWVI